MNLSEYSKFDGLSLAQLVKNQEISPVELSQLGLQAIELANPAINAIIETYPDAKPDNSAAINRESSPFYGVPFLLKDIGSHDAGVTFELGSRLTQGMQAPPWASSLVQRFKQSGVSILGRTNVPELGSSCVTEPLLHGPTRNPWNLDKTPGGSSGGAAAAVAAGIVPIAHANDAGGSIRFPAHCCGLFGLKPSRNLNPHGPDEALAVNGLACELIVSRSVRDTAAMLDVTAGPDVGAWCYTPRHTGSYLKDAATPPSRPLRIGVCLDSIFPPTPIKQNVKDTIRATASLCEDLGHHVEFTGFDLDPDQVLKPFCNIWASGLGAGIEQLSQLTGRKPSADTLEPHVLLAYQDAQNISSIDLQKSLGCFNTIARAYGKFFQQYDVMLTPASSSEPFDVGIGSSIKATSFYDWFMQMSSFSPFTSLVNAAGVPAMSVPLGWSDNHLPIGSHFVGALGQELMLLKLATQLEKAQPWFGKLPPHHVANLASR